MKLRMITAIVLLALSISAAVFCLLRMSACADELAAALETAMASAGSPQWEEATRGVTRLWERDRDFLHILLPHINLNELEWALGSLREYQQQRDKALYVEQCVRGLQCVNTVREMERPNWGNVF